jgi:hypothetical protein
LANRVGNFLTNLFDRRHTKPLSPLPGETGTDVAHLRQRYAAEIEGAVRGLLHLPPMRALFILDSAAPPPSARQMSQLLSLDLNLVAPVPAPLPNGGDPTASVDEPELINRLRRVYQRFPEKGRDTGWLTLMATWLVSVPHDLVESALPNDPASRPRHPTDRLRTEVSLYLLRLY